MTPPALPPPPPPPAPPAYGRANGRIGAIRRGLEATFVFSELPTRGARVKVVWLYNNRKLGEASKAVGKRVTSTVRGSRGLPRGYWRAQLLVRLGRAPFRTVSEARTRLR